MTHLLDPAVQDSIVQSVEDGEPVDVAATRAGISPRALAEWLEIMRDSRTTWPRSEVPISPQSLEAFSLLSHRIARARAERVANLVKNIRDWRNAKGDDDWRQYAWLLERSPDTKRDWSQYREQYTTVEQVRLSPEQHYVEQLATTGGYEALLEAEQALKALPSANSQEGEG